MAEPRGDRTPPCGTRRARAPRGFLSSGAVLISPESPWKEVAEQDGKFGRNVTSGTAFLQRARAVTFANCQPSAKGTVETPGRKCPSAGHTLMSENRSALGRRASPSGV